jgi:hypothetical protein
MNNLKVTFSRNSHLTTMKSIILRNIIFNSTYSRLILKRNLLKPKHLRTKMIKPMIKEKKLTFSKKLVKNISILDPVYHNLKIKYDKRWPYMFRSITLISSFATIMYILNFYKNKEKKDTKDISEQSNSAGNLDNFISNLLIQLVQKESIKNLTAEKLSNLLKDGTLYNNAERELLKVVLSYIKSSDCENKLNELLLIILSNNDVKSQIFLLLRDLLIEKKIYSLENLLEGVIINILKIESIKDALDKKLKQEVSSALQNEGFIKSTLKSILGYFN